MDQGEPSASWAPWGGGRGVRRPATSGGGGGGRQMSGRSSGDHRHWRTTTSRDGQAWPDAIRPHTQTFFHFRQGSSDRSSMPTGFQHVGPTGKRGGGGGGGGRSSGIRNVLPYVDPHCVRDGVRAFRREIGRDSTYVLVPRYGVARCGQGLDSSRRAQ